MHGINSYIPKAWMSEFSRFKYQLQFIQNKIITHRWTDNRTGINIYYHELTLKGGEKKGKVIP
jgi:hypothetical protein